MSLWAFITSDAISICIFGGLATQALLRRLGPPWMWFVALGVQAIGHRPDLGIFALSVLVAMAATLADLIKWHRQALP